MLFTIHLLHYDVFRLIANGMLMTMSLYALFSYFKNKNLTFLLYSITLVSGLIEYYITDQFYKKGNFDIATSTFAFEVTCLAVVLYCIFITNTFRGHIQDKYFFKILSLIIQVLIITIFTNLTLKISNYQYLVTWVYGLTIIICTILFALVFKALYKRTFSFMKYYFIGSIFITTGWILKCIFQAYPRHFSSFITFNNNNAFTFPNTYGELGAIFESIFIFIAISESHRLLESSKIDLKKKILLSIEENNNKDKLYLESKQKVLKKINTAFNQNLLQSNVIIKDIIKLLENGDINTAKEKLHEFSKLSHYTIQIIRRSVRIFNKQNELIFSKSIESKAFEISSYHLSQKKLSFSLYVNESELWSTISDEFEERILILYEHTVMVFVKFKDFFHLIVNFSIHSDGNLFFIIQDDGNVIKSKNRMIEELNQIAIELAQWKGEVIYSIEYNEESVVRVNFKRETIL